MNHQTYHKWRLHEFHRPAIPIRFVRSVPFPKLRIISYKARRFWNVLRRLLWTRKFCYGNSPDSQFLGNKLTHSLAPCGRLKVCPSEITGLADFSSLSLANLYLKFAFLRFQTVFKLQNCKLRSVQFALETNREKEKERERERDSVLNSCAPPWFWFINYVIPM